MQDTYSDRGVEIREYRTLGTRDFAGLSVSLCEWEDRPFILLRAKSWKGRQPRFALAPKLDDDFVATLADLGKVTGPAGTVTLGTEESIRIGSGLLPWSSLDASTRAAWDSCVAN